MPLQKKSYALPKRTSGTFKKDEFQGRVLSCDSYRSNSVDDITWCVSCLHSFSSVETYAVNIPIKLPWKLKKNILKIFDELQRAEIEQRCYAVIKFEALGNNYCEICDIKTKDCEPLWDHFNGNKHIKNINNPELKKRINFEVYNQRMEILRKTIESRKRNIFYCEICSVVFRDRTTYNTHKKSEKHRKVLCESYRAVRLAENGKIWKRNVEN